MSVIIASPGKSERCYHKGASVPSVDTRIGLCATAGQMGSGKQPEARDILLRGFYGLYRWHWAEPPSHIYQQCSGEPWPAAWESTGRATTTTTG
jgi:hypothetical protein